MFAKVIFFKDTLNVPYNVVKNNKVGKNGKKIQFGHCFLFLQS